PARPCRVPAMPADPPPNPLFSARREALVTGLAYLAALLWTVPYCYLRGYQHPPGSWVVEWGLAAPRGRADLDLILGVPDWVAVGILLPWGVATVFTLWFAAFFMKDEDLGPEADEGVPHGP